MATRTRGSQGTFRLSTINKWMMAIALIISFLLFYASVQAVGGYRALLSDTDNYITAQQAVADMQEASDYLTAQVRVFTITGARDRVDNFFTEMKVTQRREHAIEEMKSISEDASALAYLEQALTSSNELVKVELHAFRLRIASMGDDISTYPEELRAFNLPAEELAMSPEEQRLLAQDLVFDDAYQTYKDQILEYVHMCTRSLIDNTYHLQLSSSEELYALLRRQQILTIVMMVIVLAITLLCAFLIIRPLQRGISSIQEERPMPVGGAYEVSYLAESYNEMYERTRRNQDKLSYEATHDPLTGLLNRKAYENAYLDCDKNSVALILVDVDDFKGINDTYGHAEGDRVLKKVASILQDSFRSEDRICRIGGDEFAVLMLNANHGLSELVRGKMARINEKLQNPEDGLPKVSLSIGVAFSDRERPQGDLFLAADTALYRVKNSGRNGCEIYSESMTPNT